MLFCVSRLGWAVKPIFCLVTILLLQPCDVFGTCIKEVKYLILKSRTHAIENGVDIDDLTTIDLLRGNPELTHIDVTICIDASGYLTRTTTQIQSEQSFYPHPIHTTVYTSSGTSFYKKDGTLISTKAHVAGSVDQLPGVSVPMTTQQINEFGLNVNFQNIESNFSNHFISLNGTQWSVGTKAYFSSPEFDAVIARSQLYYLTSNFNHAGDLISMNANTYREINGYLIPQFELRNDYEDLSQGKLQSTTLKAYLSYEVISNGLPIVQYVEESPNHTVAIPKATTASNTTQFSTFLMPRRATPLLELYPNPASNILNIKFKAETQNYDATWNIQDNYGRIVLKGEKAAGTLRKAIPISQLLNGHYILTVYTNDQFYSRNFLIAQ